MINNNGIDIQTSPGAAVHSVYDGVVQSVVNIPGINMVVAIQHGDYFTVYSKLSNVSVSVGTRVKTGKIRFVKTRNPGFVAKTCSPLLS
jgi:septal ring factor EnvC (AmiA/AmiB activator)